VERRFNWDTTADLIAGRLSALLDRQELRFQALGFLIDGSKALSDDRPWEACTALEAALRLEPRFPDALSEYGVALARTGRLDEARYMLETATRLDPQLEAARASLDAVSELLQAGGVGVANGER
jgi:Flp pilus assembly protein TadD